MRLVIDTNMIIAALIKDSKAREIIMNKDIEFISPDFVIEETYKYEDYICEKSGLTKEEFELLLSLIFEKIKIIPVSEYETFMEEAKRIMKDMKDVPYLACALSLKCDGIWTNDKDFNKQNKIKIWYTEDLIKLFLK